MIIIIIITINIIFIIIISDISSGSINFIQSS